MKAGNSASRALAQIAERRGWRFVRMTAHNGMLYEYPPNGARFTLSCSPGSKPPIRDMERKLIRLESAPRP